MSLHYFLGAGRPPFGLLGPHSLLPGLGRGGGGLWPLPGGGTAKKKRQRGWLELSLCHPPLGLVGVPGVGCPPCSGIAGVRVPLGVSHTLAGERRIVAKSHHTP